MILYVNGCSHTAAAEANVQHAFAEDDSDYHDMGRRPHPDNLKVSWGRQLANLLSSEFYCDAESAASNARILRTTRDWIKNNPDKLAQTFMVIQFTTWEREEWLYPDGTYYQVNASGIDLVPADWEEKYKRYVIGVNWDKKTKQAHDEIWSLHCELTALGINHLFFSAHSSFSDISLQERHDWNRHYIEPYSREHTYNAVLKNNGFPYTCEYGYHFGKAAHSFWAQYVLQCIQDYKLLDPLNEVPAD